MKQIFTREQLEAEIENIIYDEVSTISVLDEHCIEYGNVVQRICDLIADLNNLCFHSKESDDRR